MAWKWYDSTVIQIEDASPTTKRFWVEVDEVDSFDFEPGQFVTMDLPISDKRLKRWRSYSIANGPDGTNVLEFCIVKLEGGAASEYLWNEIKLGSTIRFKGPSGTFVLPPKLDFDMVMICTGTGVAPFRSMLQEIERKAVQHKNLHLIFGTRSAEGILYQEEFLSMTESIPNFKYSIALSREETEAHHSGYVHDIYLKAYKKKKEDIHFYLCGWTGMIDDAVANLIIKMGYDKSQVHYELYG